MTDDFWLLTDHSCRHCLGRVLEGNGDIFRCADCGVEGKGRPEEICGCGLQVGEGKIAARRLFRCEPNPNRTTACPSEVVIGFGDRPPAAARTEGMRQLIGAVANGK
jgi:hypothetical protein